MSLVSGVSGSGRGMRILYHVFCPIIHDFCVVPYAINTEVEFG